MALTLNLIRNKRKKKPHYSLIIRDEKIKKHKVDKVGYFNPISNPKKMGINIKKLKFWLANGAQIKNKKLFKIIKHLLL